MKLLALAFALLPLPVLAGDVIQINGNGNAPVIVNGNNNTIQVIIIQSDHPMSDRSIKIRQTKRCEELRRQHERRLMTWRNQVY